jgi:hypothetical protein
MCLEVRKEARDGAHTGAPQYAYVNCVPLRNSLSMLGVEMLVFLVGPRGWMDGSENPTTDRTMRSPPSAPGDGRQWLYRAYRGHRT